MKFDEFEQFFQNEVKACHDILLARNADYSAGNDKLANFKLAGRIDGISPIIALYGMSLKHRTSIEQGIQDLIEGKSRPLIWWQEKLRDLINYMFLLGALLKEAKDE